MNRYFPAAALAERDVIGAYAGLRPLVAPADASSPSDTSREEEIFESAAGMLSLGGGKLTTYRRVAERVVDRVVERLRGRDPERRFGPCRTGSVPLPGAELHVPERGGFGGYAKRMRASAPTGVDDSLMTQLLHRFGTRASEIVALTAADPDAARRIVPELAYRRAEVTYTVAAEMAATLDDMLRRRVPLAFRVRDGGVAVSDDVANLMRAVLGWTAEETAAAIAAYRDGVERERALRVGERTVRDGDVERRLRA